MDARGGVGHGGAGQRGQSEDIDHLIHGRHEGDQEQLYVHLVDSGLVESTVVLSSY